MEEHASLARTLQDVCGTKLLPSGLEKRSVALKRKGAKLGAAQTKNRLDKDRKIETTGTSR